MDLPFQFIRIPNLRLKVPQVHQPSPMLMFALVFASYFLVISGIIYDIIVEPPSMGSTQDPTTGAVRPVAILQWRVNGQYIIEGLAAGMLFAVGGTGFILIDRACQKFTSNRNRYFLLVAGGVCILAAYNLSLVFLRIKVPGLLFQHSYVNLFKGYMRS